MALDILSNISESNSNKIVSAVKRQISMYIRRSETRQLHEFEIRRIELITETEVNKILSQLSEETKEIFLGFMLGEIDTEKVAEAYGLKIQSVKNKYTQMLSLLYEYLMYPSRIDRIYKINQLFAASSKKVERSKMVSDFLSLILKNQIFKVPPSLEKKLVSLFAGILSRNLKDVDYEIDEDEYLILFAILKDMVNKNPEEIYPLYDEIIKLLPYTTFTSGDLRKRGIYLALIGGLAELYTLMPKES